MIYKINKIYSFNPVNPVNPVKILNLTIAIYARHLNI